MADDNIMIPADRRIALLKLDKAKITVDDIARLFGYTTDASSTDKRKTFEIQEPYFKTTWKLHLDAKEYINLEPVDTNVGIFLFNKLIVEGTAEDFVPNHYFNEVVTKKKFGVLLNYLSTAVRNQKLDLTEDDNRLYFFLRDYEFWSLRLPAIFSPGYTMRMIKPDPEVMKEKEKLLKEDPKSVEDMIRIEDKLVDLAKKRTEGDSGRTLFDSGSRGSFANDYKNMSIMVGAVQNPLTGNYDLMSSNYIDGLSKKDLVAAGNIIVNSEYPKAIGTARGGYITKQFYAAFQGITLGPPKTFCGTKQTLPIDVTEQNGDSLIDQYIRENGKAVLLTEENISSYYGKRVHLYSPQFCIAEDPCNICMGERFYKLGAKAIGLTATRMSNTIMTKNLKLRHNMKVVLQDIDPNEVLVMTTSSIKKLGKPMEETFGGVVDE